MWKQSKEPYVDRYMDEQGNEVTRVTTPKSYIMQYETMALSRIIVDRLAAAWIEQYGAELLKKVAPEKVQEEIEKQISRKFFEGGQ